MDNKLCENTLVLNKINYSNHSNSLFLHTDKSFLGKFWNCRWSFPIHYLCWVTEQLCFCFDFFSISQNCFEKMEPRRDLLRNPSDIRNIIKDFKDRPMLWDMSHEHYYNIYEKQKELQRFAEKYNTTGSLNSLLLLKLRES